MAPARSAPTTIDEYIAARPPGVRTILKRSRRAIHDAVPDAEEGISYRIPVFKRHGVLVYFAAFRHHIELYPPLAAFAGHAHSAPTVSEPDTRAPRSGVPAPSAPLPAFEHAPRLLDAASGEVTARAGAGRG